MLSEPPAINDTYVNDGALASFMFTLTVLSIIVVNRWLYPALIFDEVLNKTPVLKRARHMLMLITESVMSVYIFFLKSRKSFRFTGSNTHSLKYFARFAFIVTSVVLVLSVTFPAKS